MKHKKITELISGVREHVVMRDYLSWRAGGVADYFVEVRTINELISAVRAALKLKIPYFILGNGSNVLFSDYGFAGIVIKNMTSQIAIMAEKSQAIVDSGVMLGRLIMVLASSDLAGLEFLYGVPGTVGGAVYGNAGAWGSAIGDYIKSVTLLEVDAAGGKAKIIQSDGQSLEFAYRSSAMKNLKGKYKPVILAVRFQLSQCPKEEIIRRLSHVKTKRHVSQPAGASAGSVFRNPIPRELKDFSGIGSKNMPALPKERTAGFMLEQAGAKGLSVGGATVSRQHANFIINAKDAKASEIRTLIEEMRSRVKEKFNVVLDEEIEYIGQW